MSNFFHIILRSPLRRGLAVFLVLSIVLLVLRLAAGTVWQARLSALIPTAIAIVLLIRFGRSWQAARYGVMRWQLRRIRSWRAYSRKPPIVEALHHLGAAIVLLSMAGLVTGLYSDVRIGSVPALIVFVVAGVCEIVVQTKRIFKQAWAQAIGKVLSLSLGVILTAATVSMAKHTVHSLAHIDPKYMTEFTAAIVAGLLPLVYVGAAGVLLLLWSTFQMFLLGAILFGGSLLAQAKSLIGERVHNRVRLFWYRIRTGKRPPGGLMPEAVFMPPYEVSLVGSALSKIAVVWALTVIGEGIAVVAPGTTPMLVKAMVLLEYRLASGCRNIDAGAGVVYMDDGNVSVARLVNDRYRFTVEKCEYGSGK